MQSQKKRSSAEANDSIHINGRFPSFCLCFSFSCSMTFSVSQSISQSVCQIYTLGLFGFGNGGMEDSPNNNCGGPAPLGFEVKSLKPQRHRQLCQGPSIPPASLFSPISLSTSVSNFLQGTCTHVWASGA